jgi:hypothetical protein
MLEPKLQQLQLPLLVLLRLLADSKIPVICPLERSEEEERQEQEQEETPV